MCVEVVFAKVLCLLFITFLSVRKCNVVVLVDVVFTMVHCLHNFD